MATLFGVVMLTHQIGGFLGAWLGGKVFEATGSYDWVWYIDIVLAVGAALVHLPIPTDHCRRSCAIWRQSSRMVANDGWLIHAARSAATRAGSGDGGCASTTRGIVGRRTARAATGRAPRRDRHPARGEGPARRQVERIHRRRAGDPGHGPVLRAHCGLHLAHQPLFVPVFAQGHDAHARALVRRQRVLQPLHALLPGKGFAGEGARKARRTATVQRGASASASRTSARWASEGSRKRPAQAAWAAGLIPPILRRHRAHRAQRRVDELVVRRLARRVGVGLAQVDLAGGARRDRSPAARSIASQPAWLGTHQLLSSPAKRCSMKAILGQPASSSGSRSVMGWSCVSG
jgi:hypothetical protein